MFLDKIETAVDLLMIQSSFWACSFVDGRVTLVFVRTNYDGKR